MAFGNATKGFVRAHSGGGGGGGTLNYNDLSNKPKINGVELTGNKTSGELNIGAITVTAVNVENNRCQFNIDDVKMVILVASYSNPYTNKTNKYSLVVTPIEIASGNVLVIVGDSSRYVTAEPTINQNQVTLSMEYDGGLTFSKVYLVK